MNQIKITEWCRKQKLFDNTLVIPDEVFIKLAEEDVYHIINFFTTNVFLYLPKREIEFFEWLKINDFEIWVDLWSDLKDEKYKVSISFLPFLIDRSIGFPICDLKYNDNYYFNSDHIVDKEALLFIDSIKKRFEMKKPLNLTQMLLLHISESPTDIWHFAYVYNFNLEDVKNSIRELIDDNMLIHLAKAEHLAGFIKF